MSIEYKTEDFRTNGVVYSYIFVNEKEVGFVANDVKKKTHTFFYDATVDGQSPSLATKKEMVAWLNANFG
jgi:hypothetical protein